MGVRGKNPNNGAIRGGNLAGLWQKLDIVGKCMGELLKAENTYPGRVAKDSFGESSGCGFLGSGMPAGLAGFEREDAAIAKRVLGGFPFRALVEPVWVRL
jgi:hypothetical protein